LRKAWKKIKPIYNNLRNNIEEISGILMSPSHPIFAEKYKNNAIKVDKNKKLYYSVDSSLESLIFLTEKQWNYMVYRNELAYKYGNNWNWVIKKSKEWGEFDELLQIAISYNNLEIEYQDYCNGKKVSQQVIENIKNILNNGINFIEYNSEEGLLMESIDSRLLTFNSLPKKISNKFGEWSMGVWGEFFDIKPEYEKDIVNNLNNLGYTCIKKELDFNG